MRFHHLEIENLASLKNRHVIDFELLSQQEDLFAITGKTGSGKSTILSAIALALYGANYKKSMIQEDLVSQDKSSARVDLVFTVNGAKYRAHWECKTRKKDGSRLKHVVPKRQLFKYHSDDHEEALETNIEDLININFDQFCKTVILNQGEFHRFLTSSFSERKVLLEKLFHKEGLDLIGKSVNAKCHTKIQEYQNLLQQSEGILPFDNETYLEIVKQIERNDQRLQTLGKDLKSYQQLMTPLAELKTAQGKFNSNSSNLNHNKTSLKDIFDNWGQLQSLLRQANIDLKEHQQRKAQRRPVLMTAIELKQNLNHHTEKAGKVLKDNQYLSDKLKNLKYTLADNQKEYDQAIKELKSLNESLIHPKINKEFILATNDRYKNLQSTEKVIQLTESSYEMLRKQKDTYQIGQIEEQLKEVKNQIENVKNQTHILKDQKSSNETRLLKFQQQHNQTSLLLDKKHELNQKLLTISNSIKADRLKLEKLTHDLEIKQVLSVSQKINQSIRTLIELHPPNDNCPLCEQAWSQTKQLDKLRSLKGPHDESLADLTKLSEDKQRTISRLNLQEETQKDINSQLESFDQELASKVHQLNLKCQELKSSNTKLLTKLEQLAAQHSDLISKKAQMDEKRSQANKVYSATEECLSKLTEAKDLFENMNQLLRDQWGFVLTTEEFSSSARIVEKIGYAEKQVMALTNVINDKKKNIEITSEEHSKIASEEKSVNAQIHSLQNKLKELELDNSLSPSQELEELETKEQTLEKELKNLENQKHQVEIKKSQFQTKVNLLEQEQQLLSSHWSETYLILINFVNQLSQSIDVSAPLLDKLKTQKPLSITDNTDVLWAGKDHIEQQCEILKNEVTEISNTLIEDKTKVNIYLSKKEQQAELQRCIKLLKKDISIYENLKDILGTRGNKDEFRNFVLGLLQINLIDYANHELNTLCNGRYQLVALPKNSPKDFYIQDKFHGEGLRKVATLSGGETFMVSLALALALAELSKGTSDLDCFFIDEGFGTLDEESIEQVLEVLHSLQNRGKQIGLISHIKELTNRISQNLVIHKSNLGSSSISLHIN